MNDLNIRKMEKKDKKELLEILLRTGVFSKKEITIAEELMDSFIKDKEQKDYIIYVSEIQNKMAGYVCFGPTPCTEGTFDLYWIAVAPEIHGQGIGTRLLSFAEEEIKSLGGRMIIVETSSTERYKNTRKFYLSKKYKLSAVIKDFYRRKDNKMIFTKKITYSRTREK